jgi:hypothetical protein
MKKMTTENKKVMKNKVIAGSLTTLLTAAIIGLLYLQDSNKSMSDMLDAAKLKSERFLSEKLSLDKEIDNLKKQKITLGNKNSELDKLLASTNSKLANKEKELKAVQWDKNKSKKLEAELAEIRKVKGELENQLAMHNETIKKLRGENERLSMNAASLKEQYEALVASSKVANAINANNWKVETTKGKRDRLTVVARKTKKISMGFDVPQNLVENINFKITSPNGSPLPEGDRLSYIVIDNDSDFVASASPTIETYGVTKRIEMTYRPKANEKLVAGIYRIDVYEKNTYINSYQVRLR